MIAMPSSSTATMNVSRNWPSAIIGRKQRCTGRFGATVRSCDDAAVCAAVRPGVRCDGAAEPLLTVHRLGNVPAYEAGSGSVVAGALRMAVAPRAAARARVPDRARRQGRGASPRARTTDRGTALRPSSDARSRPPPYAASTINRCTSGLRSLIDATLYASMMACAMVRSLHDAAVDEDVLRAARRALFRQARQHSRRSSRRRVSRRTSIRSVRSP